ncbi:hypothetical protein NAT51_04085 [Flavobacterium amniphilum]|uniref:hypothetical protein n=1 Tax=Flavobacterium amniphilum TaxID=1834035 RepID=UPI00202A4F3A|nr:hypothetical protein [Flavobacterium amniphilum]MCL9804687.1 hypothetical protein [Flavobacterium amniphilum]
MKTINDFKKNEVNGQQLISISGGAGANVQVVTTRNGNTVTAVYYDDANGNGRLDSNERVIEIQRYTLHAQ